MQPSPLRTTTNRCKRIGGKEPEWRPSDLKLLELYQIGVSNPDTESVEIRQIRDNPISERILCAGVAEWWDICRRTARSRE